MTLDWDNRVAEVWATSDERDDAANITLIERLASELPAGDPRALFELAGAFDAAGQEADAIPLYRQALDAGLQPDRRRRAVIQLASSLRSVGSAAEAVDLLTAELVVTHDDLDDAVRAFLALALADCGREREAVTVALTALASRLPLYQRAVTSYASELTAASR